MRPVQRRGRCRAHDLNLPVQRTSAVEQLSENEEAVLGTEDGIIFDDVPASFNNDSLLCASDSQDSCMDLLSDISHHEEDAVSLDQSTLQSESQFSTNGGNAIGPGNSIDFAVKACCSEQYSNLQRNWINCEESSGCEDMNGQPLYKDSPLTMDESDLLIMSFAVRWGLQDDCVKELVELIDCHLPQPLMASRDCVLKKFKTPDHKKIVFTCPFCFQVLQDEQEQLHCDLCYQKLDRKTLQEDGNYFLQLSISEQIKEIVESEYLFPILRKRCSERDVMFGRIYSDLRRTGIIGCEDLTIQWNTDALPLLASSQWKVWPIQVCINELPFAVRKNNMILCGLYFGKHEPRINSFFRPFVHELEVLHLQGVKCKIPGSDSFTTVKVHAIVSAVSWVMKPILQGLTKDSDGCPFCLRSGMRIDVEHCTASVYIGGMGAPRTLSQHVYSIQSLYDQGKQIGDVESPSVFLMLPVFDIATSFVPDYYCIVDSIVKQFLKHWTDSRYDHCEWYLTKAKCAELSLKLQNVSFPIEIEGLPGTFDELLVMKPSQCLHFLIYCSIIFFKGILPPKYLNHWFLLVRGISLYLQQNFSNDEADEACFALNKFVEEIHLIYPNCFHLYTLNVHILLHIPLAVKDYGALWATSTDSYEEINRILAQVITCFQFDLNRLYKSYMRLKQIFEIESTLSALFEKSKNGKKLFHAMLFKFKGRSFYKDQNLKLLGRPSTYKLSNNEKLHAEQVLGVDAIDSVVLSFNSMIYHGNVLHASVPELIHFCPNSIVKTDSGCLLWIKRILVVSVCGCDQKKCIVMGIELDEVGEEIVINPYHNFSSTSAFCLYNFSNRTSCWLPQSLNQKCVGTPYGRVLSVVPMIA